MSEMQNAFERFNLIVKEKDETIAKMSEEMFYLQKNAKKCKNDAERCLKDAMTYEEIVRKIKKKGFCRMFG